MASFVLLAVCFGLIVYKAYKYMFFRPPNFPPGPPRIPFFGSYVFLLLINYKHLHHAIDWMCKYYKTNVLGMYLGSFAVAIANDAASIKEAMFNTKMDGRPDVFLAQLRHPNNVTKGIFFTKGLFWRDERRFTLRHLRDFGFGRRFAELELDLDQELRQLVEIIKYGPKYPHEQELFHNGEAMCPNIFIALAANSFLKVMCNERVPREKQGILLRAAKDAADFTRLGQSSGRLLSIMPWIVKIFPDSTGYTELKPAVKGQYEFMKNIIDEQYRTYDENHERHFLDVYFKEMKAAERSKHFRNAEFSYDQLIMTCSDFFMPSSVAIPLTTAFLIRLLILHPHMKQRAQAEIYKVVGRSRLPTLSDRNELPYTEACIRESLRYNTLIPNGIPRLALDATTLSKYDIPADCVIGIGLRSAHLDSNQWDDPNKFEPERFLSNDGKLDLKKDVSTPFGAGKRLCAGETHARNLMFLLTTTILQNFDISVSDESKIPRDSDFITGIASFVPEFFVKFEAR